MRNSLAVVLLLSPVCPLFAADAPKPSQQVTKITRAAGPITIDGKLDDAGWKGAAKFETWYETNPGDNIEPKVKTVGYVTFDSRFLYFGIESFDPAPPLNVYDGEDEPRRRARRRKFWMAATVIA